jgi:hypothetical protein
MPDVNHSLDGEMLQPLWQVVEYCCIDALQRLCDWDDTRCSKMSGSLIDRHIMSSSMEF